MTEANMSISPNILLQKDQNMLSFLLPPQKPRQHVLAPKQGRWVATERAAPVVGFSFTRSVL